ncbi:hypothetical protein K431DRAFT_286124 [Polychaeton citri CBS 116435]|uniref:RED-like N-terminal domain-containing protein n=1 Tax=Polychaeton citri CBS 116435 TaxID=1314669 RepID=A0A9P4ULG4_9PEZI|nr:hypothetical protein K431DRAFT_286124 [Polychaeton citri CBS 116435]
MNNSEFRKLLEGGGSGAAPDDKEGIPATSGVFGGKRGALGSVAPRDTKGSDTDFLRQFRERNAALQPTKKFRSSKAPKGTKYGAGYVDRARARAEAEEAGQADEKAERIKALEEQMKLGQISEATFYALRDEITGGDVGATHLVKGLDRKLLERVRRGEDVMGLGTSGESVPDNQAGKVGDVDNELEKLGSKEVETLKRAEKQKKGNAASSAAPVAGVKRTRDQVMAELKAQRKAAAEARAAAAPKLDSRFKRVDEAHKPNVEIDAKGREIITVIKDGKVKKMVRKAAPQPMQSEKASGNDAKPVLGADVAIPTQAQTVSKGDPGNGGGDDDDDDDIFEGVGTDYNPLAALGESSGGDSDDSESEANARGSQRRSPTERRSTRSPVSDSDESETAKPPTQQQRTSYSVPRNYFNEKPQVSAGESAQPDHTTAIQEVLKKAAKMDPLGSDKVGNVTQNAEELARHKRRAEMLSNHDRDMDDMDIGFGGSRFDEEDGGDDAKVRLSQWKGKGGAEDDGWEEEGERHGGKKKRKPKKRKGDVDNVDDVMRVIEGRKQKSG